MVLLNASESDEEWISKMKSINSGHLTREEFMGIKTSFREFLQVKIDGRCDSRCLVGREKVRTPAPSVLKTDEIEQLGHWNTPRKTKIQHDCIIRHESADAKTHY